MGKVNTILYLYFYDFASFSIDKICNFSFRGIMKENVEWLLGKKKNESFSKEEENSTRRKLIIVAFDYRQTSGDFSSIYGNHVVLIYGGPWPNGIRESRLIYRLPHKSASSMPNPYDRIRSL